MVERTEFSVSFPSGRPLRLGRRTRVMGILNVTPDSFSDGGVHLQPEIAVEAALRMERAGADLIDVGGESTRPGAEPVGADEEADRILPVLEGLRGECTVRISVDTRRAGVARQALDAGADLLNDVSALRDPDMLPLIARRGCPAILMHMRGTPRTMQRDTRYEDLIGTVSGFLEDAVATALDAGVTSDKILVDPGVGFGKSTVGNLALLAGLSRLARVGRPIVVGASRKRFIGRVLDLPVGERLEGSLAVAAFAAAEGAHVIRVHDVAATVRVVRMIDAIRET